jgi:hypothetical protein
MSDLTIFPVDIAEMSVSQLAALPPEQKREVDKNLDAAIDWLKKARTKFDAALEQCYGEQARAALRESGRDFGTAHISDGPLRIKFELPKKVSWNQKAAGRNRRAHRGLGREGRGLPRRQALSVRVPVHQLASGTAAAVRRRPHGRFRQAVLHLEHRWG